MASAAALLDLSVPNRIDRLTEAVDAVEAFLRDWSVSEEDRALVLVMLDEIASNIIQYAWPATEAHHFTVALHLARQGPALLLTMDVADDGAPFDPTNTDPPDLDADLDERSLGGLGLFMVGEISDDVRYCRQDGKNCLHVTKRLRSDAVTAP